MTRADHHPIGDPEMETLSATEALLYQIKARVLRFPPLERRYNRILERYAGPARRLNVMMLHPGRSGSTVLGNLLGQHREIHWSSEIYANFPGRYPWWMGKSDAARELLRTSMHARRMPIYGFELNFLPHHQMRRAWMNVTLSDYVRLAKSLGVSKFIVLQRRNYLRRAISVETARQTRVWHSTEKLERPDRVRIDTKSFVDGHLVHSLLESFALLKNSYAATLETLPDEGLLQLSYEEDILDDPTVAFRKVCELLRVEPGSPTVNLTRRNVFPMSEIVTNWDEVRSCLDGTEYAWMIEER